jgi:hypothetical protein
MLDNTGREKQVQNLPLLKRLGAELRKNAFFMKKVSEKYTEKILLSKFSARTKLNSATLQVNWASFRDISAEMSEHPPPRLVTNDVPQSLPSAYRTQQQGAITATRWFLSIRLYAADWRKRRRVSLEQ